MTDDLALVLQAIHRRTLGTAAYLLWRGMTPTLGILACSDLAETSEFLEAIDFRAPEVGVSIRHLNLAGAGDERTIAPHRLAPLQALPEQWSFDDKFEAAVQALRGVRHLGQGEALHEHPAPPRSPTAGDSDDFALGAWVKRQRMAWLVPALAKLTGDDDVHAVICPPPLPPGITMRGDIAQILPASKDVDGVHPGSMVSLMPFRGLQRDDVVLTRVATQKDAPELVRELAIALLLFATVTVAERQLPSFELGTSDHDI